MCTVLYRTITRDITPSQFCYVDGSRCVPLMYSVLHTHTRMFTSLFLQGDDTAKTLADFYNEAQKGL